MIRNKSESRKPTIDLSGPEGNAFCLLGYGKQWAKQLGLNWDEIEKKAMDGEYEHLLETLDKYFGEFVIFER